MKKYATILLDIERIPTRYADYPNIITGNHFDVAAKDIPDDWGKNKNGMLMILESGLFAVITDEESMILSAGMLVYFPGGLPYKTELLTDKASGWFINLPKSRVNFLPKNRLLVLKASRLILGMCEEISSWGLINKKTSIQKRLVLAFLDELARIPAIKYLTVPWPNHSSLCLVVSQIMRDPSDKKSIDYWAKVAGMSRRSFTSYFLKETGLTFAIWRQRAKIHMSIKMLLSGSSVTETAAFLNYSTTSAFSDNFRRILGLTPKQFTKNERQLMRFTEINP